VGHRVAAREQPVHRDVVAQIGELERQRQARAVPAIGSDDYMAVLEQVATHLRAELARSARDQDFHGDAPAARRRLRP